MSKVRVFYGHDGPRRPHSPAVQASGPEPAGRPESSWTIAQITSWADAHGVDSPDGLKADKLAAVQSVYDSDGDQPTIDIDADTDTDTEGA